MNRATVIIKNFTICFVCVVMLNSLASAQAADIKRNRVGLQAGSLVAPTTQTNATATSFSAGSAECHQEVDGSNVCIYRQNAMFSDPETKLWAPTIIVNRDKDNQIIKTQALADKFGHKAYYQGIINPDEAQQTAQQKQNKKNIVPVEANANIITIYPPKNLMTLEGQAVVTRNHDTITGSYLEYDTVKQTILATPKTQELTTIVFHPKNDDTKSTDKGRTP